MRIPRIYQAIALDTSQEIQLDDTASQYLLRVLRLRQGAAVVIFNGKGDSYEAELNAVTGKCASVRLLRRIDVNTESPLQLHVGLGISKGERMDYAIQKLVETGVHSVTPLLTEYTVVKLDAKRKQARQRHWEGVMISACEQSCRSYLPTLSEISEISAWLGNVRADCKLAFDASGTTRLHSIQAPPHSVCVLIGPEGGLSEHEIQLAQTQGFQLVRLGPRILRTETAAVAISAALQTLWGDY